MSKTVLYRKYRPQSFEEVLGQDHIVSVLKTPSRRGGFPTPIFFRLPRNGQDQFG